MITPELEARLVAQERNRTDIPAARHALEEAILQQFRLLARRMLAWQAVAGTIRDASVWVQAYLAETGDEEWADDTGDPEFLLFREEFAEQIAAGSLAPLRREALGEITIRAYGGRYSLWQEGRINRQLATLGSDLRVCVVGSERGRARALVGKLGKPATPPPALDGRFIAGYVHPLTAHPVAPLFDFARECAVSPLLPPSASGFYDDSRIIVRDLPFRLHDHIGGAHARHGVMAHEMGHVIYSEMEGSNSLHFLRANWPMRVREDICRFLREPRTRAELQALGDAFEYMTIITPKVGDLNFDAVVDALLREHVVVEQRDGRLHCELYAEGRPWTY